MLPLFAIGLVHAPFAAGWIAKRPLSEKIISSVVRFSRRVLRAQPIIWGLRKLPAFKHLPQVAGRSTRIVQTTLLLVMTPLVLAVGMFAVVVPRCTGTAPVAPDRVVTASQES